MSKEPSTPQEQQLTFLAMAGAYAASMQPEERGGETIDNQELLDRWTALLPTGAAERGQHLMTAAAVLGSLLLIGTSHVEHADVTCREVLDGYREWVLESDLGIVQAARDWMAQ